MPGRRVLWRTESVNRRLLLHRSECPADRLGGTVVEIDGLVPSTIILVDHALVRTFYKGAIGLLVVNGELDPEIFSVPGATTDPGGGGDEESGADAVSGENLFAATCAACQVMKGSVSTD